MRGISRGWRARHAAVPVLLLTALLVAVATRGAAKDKPENECLAAFDGVPSANANGGLLSCTDCDPACDTDGVTTPNQTCTFKFRVAGNLPSSSCTPADLKKLKVKSKCGQVTLAPSGTNSVFGSFTGTVKLKKKGKKKGKCKVIVMAKANGKPKRGDVDKLTLECNPQPAGVTCPTVTTTTSVPTTTTTLSPGSCCDFTKLRFTTGLPSIGGGGCGNVKDSAGATLFNIDCGGLYTGGGGGTLPLPTVVPDMGTSFTKIQNCSGDTFDIAATGTADVGGGATAHRQCTSAGVADPDYPACVGGTRDGLPCTADSDCTPGTCTGTMPGCLFGPPLPIPNSTFAGASVCVVNRISGDATGSATCSTGATSLNLPLASDLYLESDLLDGSSGTRPAVPGIQPCPLCKAGAPPGGSCASANCCWGGPKHDMPCTPGSSASLGEAHPTSHDCPPPPGALGAAYIGALPIPFGLTTDSTGTDPKAHKVASFINGQEVLCGFCGGALNTVFKNPPTPCTSNADCTGVTGCPGTAACGTCKQRTSGAFGTASPNPGAEHEITLFGSSGAQSLGDGAAHSATLVSAFCIPPAYNSTVDANGDLPGPGATALVGQAQLIP